MSSLNSGTIYKFAAGGVRSTFATGLSGPDGLAFDSNGNLFEADWGSGYIYEIAPGGSRSIFAIGLDKPNGLAFDDNDNLFVSDDSDTVYEFTPGGSRSIFVTGTTNMDGIAFEPSPVPEAGTLALLTVVAVAVAGCRLRRRWMRSSDDVCFRKILGTRGRPSNLME